MRAFSLSLEGKLNYVRCGQSHDCLDNKPKAYLN